MFRKYATTATTMLSAIPMIRSTTSTMCEEEKDVLGTMSPTPPLYWFHPHEDLEICYDARTRNPVYVLERLIHRSEPQINNKRRPSFTEESSLPVPYRSRNHHYKNSGYDRGHMAPAADLGAPTFTLSNCSPQAPMLNRKLWSQLEFWIRRIAERYAADTSTTAYVITGPLWLPKRQLQAQIFEYQYPALGNPPSVVSVPTHFYKLVVLVKKNQLVTHYAAFVIPNEDELPKNKTKLEDYMVRWTDLEAVVGLQFFSQLPSVTVRWKELADSIVPGGKKKGNKRNPKSLIQHLCQDGCV